MTAPADPTALGALIAGGHARRLGGQAKGLIPLPDGGSPAHRARDALAACCGRGVILVGRADHPYGALGLPTVPDGLADRGPPGGILGALEHAREGWVAVLPVDLVAPDLALLTALLPWRRGDATLWRAAGHLQPLVGWWHARAAPTLRAALTQGAPGFGPLLAALDAVVVDAPDPAALANLNRPEDLARLRPGGR